MSTFETVEIEANGIHFHCLTAGSGPLALCLHGFPDTAHTWRHLMPSLAKAGFRAVAPFLRGYAPTSTAADGMYQTGALAADAIALHDALGGDGTAAIIGHDWGAAATYGAAAQAADRWQKVVTLAVPPGGALGAAFLGSVDQLKRSWYMFFFQHPLSDLVVPAGDLAFIDRIWEDWSPGYAAADDLAHLKRALRDPANLQAALGYYRATLGAGARRADYDAIEASAQQGTTQPTLYLHGRADGCIGVDVAETARQMVGSNVTIDVVDDAGHFLHLERPDVVNARILEFLA
jgi:pimeloyl-ACP methyl ester carboxylesterase